MTPTSAWPVDHGRSAERFAVRALVAVALIVLVGVIFVGVVFGGDALLGVDESHIALRLTAAAVAAVAFEPARHRLERHASRLVFGNRDSPWEAVGRLAAEMAVPQDPGDALGTLAAVIRDGTGAARVVVWLRVDGTFTPWASSPDDGERPAPVPASGDECDVLADAGLVVPIRDSDETLGAVTVTGWGAGPRRSLEARMVEDLAAAASIVTRTVHLVALRQRRLELGRRQQHDLVAARARTVATQLAERQRLERNIHDTCQQRAVSLVGRLGLAGDGGSIDSAERVALRTAIDADIELLAATLDEVAAGRVPPDLLDDGIGAALRSATADVGVRLDIDDRAGRCGRAVEEAVFTCCMEAIQNAAKHAAARRIMVRIEREDEGLVLRVRDDGVGFDPNQQTHGRGIHHMRDRLAELGGQLIVCSGPGGTDITGRVPDREEESVG